MKKSIAGARLRLLTGAALAVLAVGGGTATAQSQLQPPPFEVPEYEGVADLPQITIRMTEINSSTADAAMPTNAFVDYVAQASEGKIVVEVFWSNALMSLLETPRGIASGLGDFGLAFPVYTPGDFPIYSFFGQLSSLTHDGFPAAWLAVSGAAAEFMIRNDEVQKEFHDFGLEPVVGFGTGGYDNLCSKPWSTLEESQGLRTRTPTQGHALQVQALGQTAVPTVATEVYEAFSRGILDCVILQPNSYISLGVANVPGDKYWVNVPLTSFNSAVMMFGKERWDSLPQLARDILLDGQILALSLQPLNTQVGFQQFGDLIRSGDIEPVLVDPEVDELLAEHDARRLEELLSEAPAQLSDPEAFIAEYRALVEKWQGIVEEMGYPGERIGITDATAYIDSWYTDYDFTPFQERLREELATARAESQ